MSRLEGQTPRIAENLLLGHTCDCCVNRSTLPVCQRWFTAPPAESGQREEFPSLQTIRLRSRTPWQPNSTCSVMFAILASGGPVSPAGSQVGDWF